MMMEYDFKPDLGKLNGYLTIEAHCSATRAPGDLAITVNGVKWFGKLIATTSSGDKYIVTSGAMLRFLIESAKLAQRIDRRCEAWERADKVRWAILARRGEILATPGLSQEFWNGLLSTGRDYYGVCMHNDIRAKPRTPVAP